MTWQQYVRQFSSRDSDARIIVRLGGDAPGRTRSKAKYLLERGEIDHEQYSVYCDAIEAYKTRYSEREWVGSHHPMDEWQSLGNGGYRRREHRS